MHRKAFLALALPFLALTIMMPGSSPALASTADEEGSPTNTIRAIRAVARGVEIEVHSTRPFPVRTLPAVLRVGNEEFVRSRYPKGGGLDTLVFLLSREEFDALATGDAVTVQYGKGTASPRTLWRLGALDKSLLQGEGSGS
jgi:hypothetical protein